MFNARILQLTIWRKMLLGMRYHMYIWKATFNQLPGGDIVLSNTEGIVISITGLRDGNPLTASWQAEWISSILERVKVIIQEKSGSLFIWDVKQFRLSWNKIWNGILEVLFFILLKTGYWNCQYQSDRITRWQ